MRTEDAWSLKVPIVASTYVVRASLARHRAIAAQGILIHLALLAHYQIAYPTLNTKPLPARRVDAALTADARWLLELPVLPEPLQFVMCLSAGFVGSLC